MKRRMHASSTWQSEKFARLPLEARLLTVALVDVADDQGRFRAHPAWVRSSVFPYDDFTLVDIECWLEAVAANGTIVLYEADAHRLGQLVNWWTYQHPTWAAPSELPPPSGWTDRVRYRGPGGKIVTENWQTSGKPQEPAPDDTAPAGAGDDFGQKREEDLLAEGNAAHDQDFGRVARALERYSGRTLSGYDSDALKLLVDLYPTEWLLQAMPMLAEKHVRRPVAYVESMMKDWGQRGGPPANGKAKNKATEKPNGKPVPGSDAWVAALAAEMNITPTEVRQRMNAGVV